MTFHRTVATVAFALATMVAGAEAQPRKAAPGGTGTQGRPAERARAELENRVRENFAGEVRKRLQLSDDQMTRMLAVNQRLDAQRRELFQQERTARVALRTELQAADDAVNQARVGELLDALLRLQRSRLELVEREQRELSAFLTPVQRARYQAFVDFMQRRMDDMSDGRGRGDGRPDGRRGGAAGSPGNPPSRGGTRPPPPPPSGANLR